MTTGQNPPVEPLKRPAADQTTGSGPAPQDSAGQIGAVPTSGAPGSAQLAAERVREDLPSNGQRRTGGDRGPGGRRKRGRGRREEPLVPEATFTSYYGRPVVKAAPWKHDVPAYLFLGGLAAGSSLLGAGADLSNRPVLRRATRLGALAAIALSMLALVRDLGRPERFVNMLRVFKPTSPMSVGTWILTAYGPAAGIAGAAEAAKLLPINFGWPGRLLDLAARPAGLAAAGIGPAVASYTGVLLGDTATPAWHDAHRELPFLFVASASAASGGFGMLTAPVSEAGPARRMAIAGAVAELAIERRMERSMGLSAETLHHGTPGKLMKASLTLTAAGALGTALLGRHRLGAAVSGLALMAGSVCTRFGVFEAGQHSARDPKYTIVPQRERADLRRAEQQAAQDAQQQTEQTTEPGEDV